jgi:hypothetical protein
VHVLLAYNGTQGGAAANNFDLTAATDADFSVRNGHYIFTEDYNIAYLMAQSAHITDARLVAPTFSALNSDGFRIAGISKTAGKGNKPTLSDRYIQRPVMMPKMEEVQFQASTATNSEIQWGGMVLTTPGWSRNLPAGPIMVMEGTTSSFTPAVNVWSGPQILTLTANPRGGVYAVIGASVQQAADSLFFRLIFPRAPYYHSRKLRPGWWVQDAVGDFEDVITQADRFHLGCWGWFHTFELPMVEIFPSTSAAMTPIVRLWCVYLGGDVSLLDAALSANAA